MTVADIANDVVRRSLKDESLRNDVEFHVREVYGIVCGFTPFAELQKLASISVAASATEVDLTVLNPAVAGLISVQYVDASTSTTRRLKRSDIRVFDQFTTTITGSTSLYARFANTLKLHPLPKNACTINLRYWSRPTFNETNPGETIIETPREWNTLLYYEALHRILIDINEFEKAQSLVIPAQMPRQRTPRKVTSYDIGIIPRLWNDMLTTVWARESIDEEFAIRPLIQRYTHMAQGR